MPVKDLDQLTLRWIIDYQHPYYKVDPAGYLSFLIGHEGRNSLLSYLISQNLALELSSGCSEEANAFSVMQVTIKLTKLGLEKYEQVIMLVQAFINMLKKEGI